jgi:hypothetical protein
MLVRNLSRIAAVAAPLLCCAAVGVLAQEAEVKPHVPLQKTIGTVTPTGPVPSLAVINSAGATLTGDKLTLTGVFANSIVFADRPVRSAGHVTTEQFIQQWDEGKDNFAKNPPNATVSILGGGSKVSDAVVTLRSPKLDGNNLTFDVSVLEGSLNGSSGPAAVFIDNFAVGYARPADDGYARHVTYWHAPSLHGAWYAGALPGVGPAAIGANAARPYYSDYYDNTCVDTPFAACY